MAGNDLVEHALDVRLSTESAPAICSRASTSDSSKLQNSLEPTIFHEPWWLKIASGDRYEVAEVSIGGKTVGQLPYIRRRRLGLVSLEMPMLTHFLGPAVADTDRNPGNVFLKKLSITRDLILKLPNADLIRFKAHRGIEEAIAFQEQRFRTSVQFTHEIQPMPEEALWANLRGKTRNVIRRAAEVTCVRDLDDPEAFIHFYQSNLQSRGIRSFLNFTICTALLAESIRRGRGRIIAGYGDANELIAANFYVWDSSAYYFLMTTRSLRAKNGVTSLLLWRALQDASMRSLIFDTDGLNSNGGILFLAGFGGVVKPRYIVSKSKFTGRFLEAFQDVMWGTNYFVRG
jgi:hypothetical protein